MSRVAVGVRDGRTIWREEEPRTAYRHVQTYGIHGVYGAFVTGGPGPVELGRRQTRDHMKRQREKQG